MKPTRMTRPFFYIINGCFCFWVENRKMSLDLVVSVILMFLCFKFFIQLLNYVGRGRKWNPLRQRLDSYEYTVKQHIVGSLLFTPLLLLLPTTSVFYIFFTMMNTSISLICMLIEVIISIIHATPYIKIVLWLVRRRRFPAGIWFEIVSCHSNSVNSPEIVSLDKIISPSKNSPHQENIRGRSHVLVSVLQSNFFTIGEGPCANFLFLPRAHWTKM